MPAIISGCVVIKDMDELLQEKSDPERASARELRRAAPTPCEWRYVVAHTDSVGGVAAIPDRNQTFIDLGCVFAGPTSSAGVFQNGWL